MSSDKYDTVDEPKPVLRSMNVTPQHYADLKSLEHNGAYITHEHPSILNHYFKGIALKFNLFDTELKHDIKKINKTTLSDFKRGYKKNTTLWQVKLVDGASILVTKKYRTSGNKLFVTVKQDVNILPLNTKQKNNTDFSPKFFVKHVCPFCKKQTDDLDKHLLSSCGEKIR